MPTRADIGFKYSSSIAVPQRVLCLFYICPLRGQENNSMEMRAEGICKWRQLRLIFMYTSGVRLALSRWARVRPHATTGRVECTFRVTRRSTFFQVKDSALLLFQGLFHSNPLRRFAWEAKSNELVPFNCNTKFTCVSVKSVACSRIDYMAQFCHRPWVRPDLPAVVSPRRDSLATS